MQNIVLPAQKNALPLPEEFPIEQEGTLMCASATGSYSLLKSQIKAGGKIAIFGVGGFGQSAIQHAHSFGVMQVIAIDINEDRLALAAAHGVTSINFLK